MQPRSARDPNYVTTLMGVDIGTVDTTSQAQVVIGADPATHRLLVNATGSIVDGGTTGASILKSDGSAAGQNSLMVAPTGRSLTGLTAGSLNADLVGDGLGGGIDVTNYRYGVIQIIGGVFSGTLTIQGSNDNANFFTINSAVLSGSTSVWTTGTTTANSTQQFALSFKYLRIRMTSYVSGTAQATLYLETLPPISNTGATVLNGGPVTTTGNAVPASAIYVGMNNAGNIVGMVSAGQAGASGIGLSNGLTVSNYNYNGSNMDEQRNNTSGAVIAAGTTSTQTNISLVTYNANKLVILPNLSAGGGSLVVTVNAVSSSGYTYPLLVSSSLSGTGATPLRIAPGLTASPNAVVNDIVPRSVQVTATVTGSLTYGVDYLLGV